VQDEGVGEVEGLGECRALVRPGLPRVCAAGDADLPGGAKEVLVLVEEKPFVVGTADEEGVGDVGRRGFVAESGAGYGGEVCADGGGGERVLFVIVSSFE